MEYIYISGKVTGLNYYKTYKKFKAAERILRNEGFATVNPMRHVPHGTEWSKTMRICITELLKCDNIYMLKDWKDSNGARIELGIAIRLGYNIIYQEITINQDVHVLGMN